MEYEPPAPMTLVSSTPFDIFFFLVILFFLNDILIYYFFLSAEQKALIAEEDDARNLFADSPNSSKISDPHLLLLNVYENADSFKYEDESSEEVSYNFT